MRPKLKSARARLAYHPEWTKEVHGCAYNMARRYGGRLAPWYEWDDLMQEAYLVFARCQRHYAGKVDNPAWFMALFKVSWRRRMVKLFNQCPAYSLFEDCETLPESAVADDVQEILELLEAVPSELKLALLDLCRPRQRFNFTRDRLQQLRSALTTT